MTNNFLGAKAALDKVIQKSRIHFYKPIQIAEILYWKRKGLAEIDPLLRDTYRTQSRNWRDVVTNHLVGNVSTSSVRFQDNIFDDNAVPPPQLALLAQVNEENNGLVENYVYQQIAARWADLQTASALLKRPPADFALRNFLELFVTRPGLQRSIDKAYEIVVYALFSTLAYTFDAKVELSLTYDDPEMLNDFARFVRDVLGVTDESQTAPVQARFYRVGVANASDRGLDIITNFGPAVQIKHVALSMDMAEKISDKVESSNIVIVCTSADAILIKNVLSQLALRVNAIVTQDDLEIWYNIALTKYPDALGQPLLDNLGYEYAREFPHTDEIIPFLKERGYNRAALNDVWSVDYPPTPKRRTRKKG